MLSPLAKAVLFALAGAALCLLPLGRAGMVRQDEPRLTLIAVGDVLFDRGVRQQIDAKGWDYPFAQVQHIVSQADITFANLECPISAHASKVAKPIAFRADPRSASCLADAGFDIISLANNHSLDCGRKGLVETMNILSEVGIRHVGAGRNGAEAASPLFVSKKGIEIAFLAFSVFPTEGVVYLEDRPGIALADVETVSRAVAKAGKRADVVVVSFHWGQEFWSEPTERQRELAHAAVDAGADLILGHHSHVLQAIERYNGALIAYGLGNFVFDQWQPGTTETVLFRCVLTRSGGAEVEALPVEIHACQPRPASHSGHSRG